MTPYVGCPAARELLERFVDGDLSTEEQVGLDAHLRWCDTCAARVDDLRLIGAGVRCGAAVRMPGTGEARVLTVAQSDLLTRIRAERDQSLAVRWQAMFADMRFLWPAMGATAAVVACVYGATMVNRIARAEHPYSMADRITTLADPGSDRNPLQLHAQMLAPRPIDHGPSLDAIPADEAVFALAAVVTRDGRIARYELLQRDESAYVSALLEAVKQSRFTPARTSDGAVAVNMVWLLARTTVRASVDPNDPGSLAPLVAPAGRRTAKPLSGDASPPAPRPARS